MADERRFGTRNLTLEEIDEGVDIWHCLSQTSDIEEPYVPLHDYLGLTWEQYSEWVETCDITNPVAIGTVFWFYDWDSLPARRTGEWWTQSKIVSENRTTWTSAHGHRIDKKTLQSKRRDCRNWADKFCWSPKQLEDTKWVAKHGAYIGEEVHKITDARKLKVIARVVGYNDGSV